MEKLDNYYDVVYKTKSGRGMIAKRVSAKTAKAAKAKVKRDMSSSATFKNIVTAIKL